MINYILIDDDDFFNTKVKNVIDKIMFNNDIEYKINIFKSPSKKLDSIIDDQTNKIYILDIDIENQNGLQIARKIRQNDWESPIIILTNYDLNLATILRDCYLILDLIYKYEDDMINKLTEDIKRSIKLKSIKNTIILKENNTIYRIFTKDILYITKDTSTRKCQIVTLNNIYYTNQTLTKLLDQLKNDFIMSHRACIVNINRVNAIDTKNNIITFDNGNRIDLISRKYKKNIVEKLN